jgi:hypothetical protein
MSFDTKNWLESNTTANTIVSFSGSAEPDVITRIVEESEQKILQINPENGKIVKITVHVLVEALQNVFHHGDPDESGNPKMMCLSLSIEKIGIIFTIGNFIHSAKLQVVKDRIDQINALSKDELKTLSKLILSNQEFSEKGGGGLGLIDIARKTGTKIEYNFVPINENLYFYILKITIV